MGVIQEGCSQAGEPSFCCLTASFWFLVESASISGLVHMQPVAGFTIHRLSELDTRFLRKSP